MCTCILPILVNARHVIHKFQHLFLTQDGGGRHFVFGPLHFVKFERFGECLHPNSPTPFSASVLATPVNHIPSTSMRSFVGRCRGVMGSTLAFRSMGYGSNSRTAYFHITRQPSSSGDHGRSAHWTI